MKGVGESEFLEDLDCLPKFPPLKNQSVYQPFTSKCVDIKCGIY